MNNDVFCSVHAKRKKIINCSKCIEKHRKGKTNTNRQSHFFSVSIFGLDFEILPKKKLIPLISIDAYFIFWYFSILFNFCFLLFLFWVRASEISWHFGTINNNKNQNVLPNVTHGTNNPSKLNICRIRLNKFENVVTEANQTVFLFMRKNCIWLILIFKFCFWW